MQDGTITRLGDGESLVKDIEQKIQYRTFRRVISGGIFPESAQKEYGFGLGDTLLIKAVARFDDDCRNGHCTFSLTGEAFWTDRAKRRSDADVSGAIGDLIQHGIPELAGMDKWHLVSTDGPMHYAGNVVYLAGNRDYNGKSAGEPDRFEHGVRFAGVPITHRVRDKFFEFIKSRYGSGDFQVFGIAHDKDPETYGTQYSLVGFAEKWHACPFRDKAAADDFCEALNKCSVEFLTVPTHYSEGKARELDAARRSAVWPEATDEELSVEPEVLKAKLAERVPALLADFRSAMESLGFDYDFPAKR